MNSSRGNCDDDFDNLLAQFSKADSSGPSLITAPTSPQSDEIKSTDYQDKEVGDNLLKDNPIAYVAGYLLRKCFQIHKCCNCESVLVTNQLEDNRNLLCFFKAYESEKTFGGLLATTKSYLDCVIQLEDIFVRDFATYTKCSGIRKKILAEFQSVPVPFTLCPEFQLEYLLNSS